MTLDSLSLLRLLRPPPDLLVLGTGRAPKQLPPGLARQLHDMGVRVDASSTVRRACCAVCVCGGGVCVWGGT